METETLAHSPLDFGLEGGIVAETELAVHAAILDRFRAEGILRSMLEHMWQSRPVAVL